MMVARFRAIRLLCRIGREEITSLAGISTTRLGQIEQNGKRAQAEDRLAQALKTVIHKRMDNLQKAADFCENSPDKLFDLVMEDDVFE